VFLILAVISWNRWIEPFVDSGRELMVPWRVAQGERPFLAAGADLLAGRSLPARTLLAALVALLHVEALRRLARRLAPPGRAALAASLAIALAAFLKPGGWLFPFSLDASIAVAALTWALALMSGPASAAGDRGAGACLALALLARPELGAAGVAAVCLGARGAPSRWLRLALWPSCAAGAGYAAVSWGVPLRTLVASGWLAMVKPPPAFQHVYRVYAGLDQPGLRLAELALCAIALLAVAALVAVAAKAAQRAGPGSGALAAATAGVFLVLGALAVARLRPPAELAAALALWPPLVRIVPAVVLAIAAARAAQLSRRLAGPVPAFPDAVLFVAVLFSLRLLLAAGYAGPYNAYFLPLPALLATIAIGRLTDRASVSLGPSLPRLASVALAVFLLFRLAALADLYRRVPWNPVATPAGVVRLPEPIASTTQFALADLERRVRPAGTLVGFPEGGFFNYVLGRRTPLREEQFFPGRLDAETEGRVARLLEERPPDAVVLFNVHAVGEGARDFGKDYLQELGGVVQRRFRVAAAFGPGAAPGAAIGDPQFFIEVRVPVAAIAR
jgi:hypothetical protein